MNRYYTYLRTLVVFLSLSLVVDTPVMGQENSKKDCLEELEKVTQHYSETYSKEKYSITLRSRIIENGERGEILDTKLWYEKDRYKTENPFMTMLVDKKYHVIVLRDTKVILLRNNNYEDEEQKEEEPILDMDLKTQIDSLMKYVEKIDCFTTDEKGKLTLSFTKEYQREMELLKKITMHYQPTTGKLKKTEYTYGSLDGDVIKTTEYLNYTENYTGNIFKGSAVSQVWANGKLTWAYKDYEIRDLRVK